MRRSVPRSPALERLIRRVRRRLWLAAASRDAVTGLWCSASLAAIAAGIHLWWNAVPAIMLAWIGAPLAAGLVVATIWRRPPEALGARTADAWLDGHTLFTSAVSLRQSNAIGGATAMVLARAEAAARDGIGQCPSWRELIDTRGTGVALTVLLIAAFLLSQPGKPAPDRHQIGGTTLPAAAIVPPPADSPRRSATASGRAANITAVSATPVPGGAPVGSPPVPSATAGDSRNGSGDRADTAPGRASSKPAPRLAAPDRRIAGAPVIPGPGDGTDAGSHAQPTGHSGTGTPGLAGLVGTATSEAASPLVDLTPEHRLFVARLLQELETGND